MASANLDEKETELSSYTDTFKAKTEGSSKNAKRVVSVSSNLGCWPVVEANNALTKAIRVSSMLIKRSFGLCKEKRRRI